MKIKVIANHFMIRSSLEMMLKDILILKEYEVECIETVSKVNKNEIKNIDYIIIYINKETISDLKIIDEIKLINQEIKIIILDMQKDEHVFVEAMYYDIDGYISNINDKNDFEYVMQKIINGNKYYESQLIRIVMNKGAKNRSIDLTNREREILYKIGKGYSNKDISKELFIAESTTKKHITNLFNKLNLKKRSELISYVHKNSIYL